MRPFQCWVLAHIQLTPEEVKKYKSMPVIYDQQLGFFFEASQDGKMKLCNVSPFSSPILDLGVLSLMLLSFSHTQEFPGYTRIIDNFKPFGATKPGPLSVPRSHAIHPSDTMPEEGLDDIKRLIKTLLPELVGRPLIDAKMCWCVLSRPWLRRFERKS